MTRLRIAAVIAACGAPSLGEAICVPPPHCPCEFIERTIALDVQVETVFTTEPDDDRPDVQFIGTIEAVLAEGQASAFAVGESHVFEPTSADRCTLETPPPREGDRRIMFVRTPRFVSDTEYLAPNPPMDASGRPRYPLVIGVDAEVSAAALTSMPEVALTDLTDLVTPAACAARFEPPVLGPCYDTGTPGGSDGCTTSPEGGPAWPWLALMLGWIWGRRRAQ